MKVRKSIRRLALGAVVGAMLLSMMPARAGTTPVIADATGDVVDIVRHTQNSFRPSTSPFPSPYTSYQHACDNSATGDSGDVFMWNCSQFDLKNSQVSTNPLAFANTGSITFTMTLNGNAPQRGDAVTSVPVPFGSARYAWYFTTSTQEASQVIGVSCSGVADDPGANGVIHDDYRVGSTNKTGAEITYTPNATCPDAGVGAVGTDNESKGISSGNFRNVLSKTNVTTPPHPSTDGWRAFAEVEMVTAANGAKRLDGAGNVVCKNGAAVCVDYDFSIGSYEGYSTVSTSNSFQDFDQTTQSRISWSVSGATITATIPWNPTVISGTDGDLVIDDARTFPWPLGIPGGGSKITALTAEVDGVIAVGANSGNVIQAICTDDTDNIFPEAVEPIRTAGAAIGTANRAVAGVTDQAQDAVQPDPDDNGVYVFGTGGHDQGDCIRGITGLLTFLDWTDNGAELRIYPRQPPYLPSASGVDCRYPIGQHALGGFGVANLTLPSIDPISVDVDTSPYDKAWKVNVFANSTTPTNSQNGPVLPHPSPVTNGTIGKDKPCGYTYWAPGIHYFDILADVAM